MLIYKINTCLLLPGFQLPDFSQTMPPLLPQSLLQRVPQGVGQQPLRMRNATSIAAKPRIWATPLLTPLGRALEGAWAMAVMTTLLVACARGFCAHLSKTSTARCGGHEGCRAARQQGLPST